MKDFDVRKLIRPDILELPGYVPITPTDVLAERLGIAPERVLKLDGNENPFGPSLKALEAIRRETAYHIYPDPDQTAVRAALSSYVDAEPERIVCGLGSDDLIDLVMRAVLAPGDAVINCPPTFGMYPFSTEVAGGRVIDVPRNEDFSLDVGAIAREASGAKAIFLASPNNPSGNLLSESEITRLLALDMLVVIDEAYIEFAGRQHSVVAPTREHENLVVLRTFSKWAGLAGLRAGYGVMPRALADVLMLIKQPYNLNVAAGVAMIAALEDRALLDERACTIAGTRDRLAAMLAEIEWLHPYPSDANFILCRLDGVDAVEVKERLAARGIFVRHFDTAMLRNHLRISAGLEQHNAIVVDALREIGGELGRS
ncbi:MAG TPA: histidinol-phosphate transaminase [Rhodanobacteraceae bacterium]|nr:histidinol-phosphate transaminase [Rhodanobacteraceae bacterium]